MGSEKNARRKWRAFACKGRNMTGGSVGGRRLQEGNEQGLVFERPDPLADILTFASDDDGRCGVDVVGIMYLAIFWVGGIDFHEAELGVVAHDFLKHRSDGIAGCAVGLPEIEDHFFVGAFEDFREAFFGHGISAEAFEFLRAAKKDGGDGDQGYDEIAVHGALRADRGGWGQVMGCVVAGNSPETGATLVGDEQERQSLNTRGGRNDSQNVFQTTGTDGFAGF